ncbi:hypothetical protein DV735_g5939, partial [Chaetothyriales sp. CBS 134920]
MSPSYSKYGCDGCLWIINHQARSPGLGFSGPGKAVVRRTQRAPRSPTEVCSECCGFFRFGVLHEGIVGEEFAEICRLWTQGMIRSTDREAVMLARITQEGFELAEEPRRGTKAARPSLEEATMVAVRRVRNADVRKGRAAGALSARARVLLRSDGAGRAAPQLPAWVRQREARQKLRRSFRRTAGSLVALHKFSADAVVEAIALEQLDLMQEVELTGPAREWNQATGTWKGEEGDDVEAMEGAWLGLGGSASRAPHARPFEVPQPAAAPELEDDEAVLLCGKSLPGEITPPGTPAAPFIPPPQAPQQEASARRDGRTMEIRKDLGLATPPPTPAASTAAKPAAAAPAAAVPPRGVARPQHAAAPVPIKMIPSEKATPASLSTESVAGVPVPTGRAPAQPAPKAAAAAAAPKVRRRRPAALFFTKPTTPPLSPAATLINRSLPGTPASAAFQGEPPRPRDGVRTSGGGGSKNNTAAAAAKKGGEEGDR